MTLNAIENFQQAQKLTKTGRLDLNTVAKLNEAISANSSSDRVLNKALELLK
jgi:peptidoglycan hydrolase-like protein with peptidoglycan-binding domain